MYAFDCGGDPSRERLALFGAEQAHATVREAIAVLLQPVEPEQVRADVVRQRIRDERLILALVALGFARDIGSIDLLQNRTTRV